MSTGYKSAEFKILTWCPAWGAPDFERRGAARSGFWGLPRGIVQILSTILASTALLAPHSAIAPQRGTPAHHSEFLGSPGKFARTSPTGSNGRDGPAAADRRTWQTPHDYDQEVRDRFAKYVEQERRAEAAGFLPPSGTGSNVYTRAALQMSTMTRRQSFVASRAAPRRRLRPPRSRPPRCSRSAAASPVGATAVATRRLGAVSGGHHR